MTRKSNVISEELLFKNGRLVIYGCERSNINDCMFTNPNVSRM